MVFVFIAGFRVVVNLDFVAVVHGHPRFGRGDGDAHEDSGVIVFIAHFVDDANDAIAELGFGPIEKAHAAVALDESIFDSHITGADVFPAVEVFAVEELAPFGGATLGERRKNSGEEKEGEDFRLHICKATTQVSGQLRFA